jgi:hypothetical protein
MAVSPDDPSFLDRLRSGFASPASRDFGLALLANSGYSSTPRTFGEVAGQSALAAQQMGQQRQMDDIKQRYMQAQIQAMQAKPATTQPSSVQEYEYAVRNGFKGSFQDWQNQAKPANDPAEVAAYKYWSSLSPEKQQDFLKLKRNVGSDYEIVDINGVKTIVYKPGAGNVSGPIVPPANKTAPPLPPGSPAPNPNSPSTPPFARPLSTLDSEVDAKRRLAAAQAAGSAAGEATAKAEFDLPRVKQNVQQSIDTIDKLMSHPGLSYITGLSSKVPVIPGTSQAAADALAKQVEGQTFLQAFNTLKGAGAITEAEGTKATGAIGRLQRSQGTADYKDALKDLRKVLSDGLERMSKQAGAGAPAMRKTVNGKTYVQQNGQWYEDDGT